MPGSPRGVGGTRAASRRRTGRAAGTTPPGAASGTGPGAWNTTCAVRRGSRRPTFAAWPGPATPWAVARTRVRRTTVTPLAWFWGDDELSAARAVDGSHWPSRSETGAPLDRWELRGRLGGGGEQVAQLHERVATPVMFGGGTLAVVTNAGALVRSTERRDGAPGGARASSRRATRWCSSRRPRPAPAGRPQKRLVDALVAAGGRSVGFVTPKAGSLAGWIEARGARAQAGAGAGRRKGDRASGSGGS